LCCHLLHCTRRNVKRHLLFVGNLSYVPNVDGVAGFVRDVLPPLRARFGDDVVLRIAGSAPVAEVVALASLPGVELIVDPADLAPHYGWADLAVIPLTAGGGTRIKLIEAFAQGVPVVATTVGTEGIDARHGTHLLIADEPTAFAEACSLLLSDMGEAERLAAAARSLVETRYAHTLGVRIIREALEPKR
jgi:glycosyltransferase involved in cell wall biosynthesis